MVYFDGIVHVEGQKISGTKMKSENIYIVTPCFNAASTIDETIWSVVSQTGNCEIYYHVQDGNSTDGTQKKLENWTKRIESMRDLLPSRVYFSWSSERDRSMYEAINTGFCSLQIPLHSYMGWINADDTLLPGTLRAIQQISQEYPSIAWLTGWMTSFDMQGCYGEIYKKTHFTQAVLKHGLADGTHWRFVQQESTFWRKSLWDAVSGINAELCFAGDWDLWRRFAAHSELTHVHRQLGGFWKRAHQKSSDLNSYLNEINSIVPLEVRKASFRTIIANSNKLHEPVALLVQDGDDHWTMRKHFLPNRLQCFAKIYSLLPGPIAQNYFLHTFFTKLIKKY